MIENGLAKDGAALGGGGKRKFMVLERVACCGAAGRPVDFRSGLSAGQVQWITGPNDRMGEGSW
jgi:hypothetical protein